MKKKKGNDTMSKSKRPFFAHYAKIFRNEFKGYNSRSFINDITAGITVGAVALPLALAFGAASVDAEHAAIGIAGGLITAIIAGLISGLLGGGSFQISGPTGAMAVILGTIVSGTYGLQGMFMATFISGAILLIAGLLRFGRFVQFIPRPVVTGFTSGIALVIAIGQLGNAFGVSAAGEGTVGKVMAFASNIGGTSLPTLVITVLVIVIMALYPKKLSKYVPASLVGIIIATIVTVVFKINVKTIGSIPTSLINSEALDIKAVDFEMLKSIGKYSVTIALLGMIESLLCGTAAASMKKEKFDSNVELIAQGVANMVVPFAGGVPSTAAIARTSVAIKSGCKTRLTSVFQSLFLILCMFVLSPLIGMVPYPALAGVLFMTAFKMNDFATIKSYFTHKLKDALILCFVTMAATVVLDLTYAIVIGVALSMILTISKLSDIKVNIEEETLIGHKDAGIVYSVGAYFFANGKELRKAIEKCEKRYETYILSFRGVVFVDVSATAEFLEAIDYIKSIGADYCFVGLNSEVKSALEKIGFQDKVGREHFSANLEDYVASMEKAGATA
uniref:Sulphate transporter n=1 Tax=uncultured bacterium Contig783 TaxID=1393612 RepID=W0FPF3_9BACT|nr:sulphate transporter [uncultured bacterium Contig783]